MEFQDVLSELNCFYYVATSKDGKWISDYVGDAILRFSGHESREFVERNLNWLDFVHKDDLNGTLKASEVLGIPPMKIIQEYRVCHRDGKIFWVRDIKQSQIKGGKFIVSGIVSDITKEKEVEEKNKSLMSQLLKKNKQLQKVLDSLQSVNDLLKDESSLVVQAALLKMERDIYPTLVRLKNNKNKNIIESLMSSLQTIFDETPTERQERLLTKRETEIISLVKKGNTQIEISDGLGLGLETVKSHVKNIKKKLGIDGKTSLFHGLKNSEF